MSRLDPFVSRTARELWVAGDQRLHDPLAAVLFADISGFTRLSERLGALGREGTEAVKDAINTVFGELIPIVSDLDGDVLKFGGDALLVVLRGGDATLRAAVAAARMQRTIRTAGRIETPVGVVRLRMSVGVESGPFDACLVGHRHRDLMAVSPLMTSLARAESAASAGEVFLGPGAVAALPDGWVDAAEDGSRLVLRRALAAGRQFGPPPAPPSTAARGGATSIDALVPPDLRPGLLAGELEAEHRPVAISFVALGGLDAVHQERGAGEVHRRLSSVTALIDDLCGRAGVVWLETDTGPDEAKWLLVAGMPRVHESPVDAMVGAVLGAVGAAPWPLRAGIHHGRVFVGPVGHPARQSFNVMGDAVNVSARLAARAAPGTVLVSEHALDRSRAGLRGEDRVRLALKGRRGEMVAQVLVPGAVATTPGAVTTAGVAPGPAATPGAGPAEVPMEGRDGELSDLLAAMDSTGVLRVEGAAGVGKTRLVAEARRRRPGRTWWQFSGAADRVHQPYWAARQWAEEVLALDLSDPAIAEEAAAEFRRDRVHTIVAERLATRIASGRSEQVPVLVVDDEQWLDEATAALVGHLGRAAEELGCCVVLTGRTRAEHAGSAPPHDVPVLTLGPLSEEAAEEVVLARLGGIADDDLLRRIKELGAGTPQFLLELAAAATSARRAGADLELPDTVEQVVGARVDRLAGPARTLLRRVAAAGGRAPVGLIAEALGRTEDDLSRELGELDSFVTVRDGDVVFDSDLVRVVAYEGLSFRARRLIHAQLATAIESHGTPDPALLAEHWLRARDHGRAWHWTRAAAASAAARGATVDAARMWRHALTASSHLDVDVEARVEVLVSLAAAAERIGAPEEALEMLRRANRLVPDDPAARAELALRQARVLERAGRYRSALAAVTRGRRQAAAAGREDQQVRLALMLGDLRYYQGRAQDSLAAAREAIAGAERLQLPAVAAQAHLVAEMASESLGLPERAEHDRAAHRLLTETGDHLGLANLLLNRSVGQFNAGDWLGAVRTGAEAAGQYRLAGDVVGAALSDNNRADLLTFQHRLEDARSTFVQCRRVLHAAGYPLGVALTVSGLSRVAAWSGALDEAGRLLDEALVAFERLGAADYLADTRLRIAEWHLLRGRPDLAVGEAEATRDLLGRLGDPGMLPATVDRLVGQAALAQGDPDRAARHFDAARHTAADRGLPYEEALARIGLAMCGRRPEEHRDEARRTLDRLGVVAPPPGLVL